MTLIDWSVIKFDSSDAKKATMLAMSSGALILPRGMEGAAKGRVERLWNTFQDRLVSELRLAEAVALEAANQVLTDFLPCYNRKFAVIPTDPELAYRKLPEGFKAEEFFCFKYPRTAGADNVVRFDNHRLQILPSKDRLSYALCKVEVHQRLDGSLVVYYQGRCLNTRPAPADAPLTVLQSLPISGIIIVFSPQDLTDMIVRKAVNMAKQMKKPIVGVVENMSYLYVPEIDKKIGIFGKSQSEEMAQSAGAPLLGQIPIDPEPAKLCDAGNAERYDAEIISKLRQALSRSLPTKERS